MLFSSCHPTVTNNTLCAVTQSSIKMTQVNVRFNYNTFGLYFQKQTNKKKLLLYNLELLFWYLKHVFHWHWNHEALTNILISVWSYYPVTDASLMCCGFFLFVFKSKTKMTFKFEVVLLYMNPQEQKEVMIHLKWSVTTPNISEELLRF